MKKQKFSARFIPSESDKLTGFSKSPPQAQIKQWVLNSPCSVCSKCGKQFTLEEVEPENYQIEWGIKSCGYSNSWVKEIKHKTH